ncbi:MAG: DUF2877 domain-containing protein [Candidatus Pelethousia sp.]|nr:DUF2877 domain-containing protein [Candidatus Pelethousia sp.]
MLRAERLCAAWESALLAGATEGSIHSVFDRAVNINTAGGMVSLLPAEKGLYPWSCTVQISAPFSALGLKPGMRAAISRAAMRVDEAGFAVDFSTARPTNLDIWQLALTQLPTQERLSALKALLFAQGSTEGMRSLAVGGADNPFSAMIRPRLCALHAAFLSGEPQQAGPAAAAIAGCGPGLTPSSDDMLLGYVCAFYALARQAGQAREAALAMGRAACRAAAAKTNAISGAFLLQCGEGLASQNMLDLFNALFSDALGERLEAPAGRILSIGAASGADILTGVVLSLQTLQTHGTR